MWFQNDDVEVLKMDIFVNTLELKFGEENCEGLISVAKKFLPTWELGSDKIMRCYCHCHVGSEHGGCGAPFQHC